ncbi:hypothetical protein ACIQMJ_40645 [Actinosynnema sp. NPDC091369]
MVRDRHFKATVRNRMGVAGQTYQQARRHVLQQLTHVGDFRHLPVMWDVAGDTGRFNPPPVKMHRAALGAVELAFRGTEILTGAQMRDYWRTLDGHIDFDWHGGPYAYEVVRELISDAENPEAPGLEPGELCPGVNRLGDLNAVWIYGVRVRFRPYEPIGAEASYRLAWKKLDDATA